METWDDPEAPTLVSRDYAAVVGEGAEFGLLPDAGGGLVVADAVVDLGDGRVDVTMRGAGRFAEAAFNGYVLTFPVTCTLLLGAAIDEGATTLPLAPDALTVTPQALRIGVAGLPYGPGDRVGVTLEVADCPLS